MQMYIKKIKMFDYLDYFVTFFPIWKVFGNLKVPIIKLINLVLK